MMGKRSAVLFGTVSVAATSVAAGLPPYFVERTPETVIVNLDLGQTSFECTGKAIDLDFGQTVYFSVAPPPDFMHFESTPGNPGTFRLYADNLTGANYGGYIVDVIASDSPTNIFSASSAHFVIGIIPEPISLSGLTLPLLLCRRRRH